MGDGFGAAVQLMAFCLWIPAGFEEKQSKIQFVFIRGKLAIILFRGGPQW